jgi:hypothetical protein
MSEEAWEAGAGFERKMVFLFEKAIDPPDDAETLHGFGVVVSEGGLEGDGLIQAEGRSAEFQVFDGDIRRGTLPDIKKQEAWLGGVFKQTLSGAVAFWSFAFRPINALEIAEEENGAVRVPHFGKGFGGCLEGFSDAGWVAGGADLGEQSGGGFEAG